MPKKLPPSILKFFKETGGRVLLCDLHAGGHALHEGPKLSYRPDAVAFHPDGKFLAVTGGNNYEVVLWDLKNNDTRMVLQGHEGPVNAVAFAPGSI